MLIIGHRGAGGLAPENSMAAMQAGFEAMEVALAYYNSVKEAAKRNAPGAQTIYEDLRSRFTGQKTKATTGPTTK